MSKTSSSKPRSLWPALIAIIVALTLYAATWPAVEIEARRFHSDLELLRKFSVRTSGFKKRAVELDPGPAWLDAFYYPLHALREIREGDNAAARYWTWWHVHLLKQRTEDFQRKVRERQRAHGCNSPRGHSSPAQANGIAPVRT